MGVITTSRLEAGEKFGPVPPTLTLAEPTMLIGHRTCDTLPDIHTVKLDVHSYSSGDRLAEWVPYVLSARCPGEQNMEATFNNGLLYFCVTRDVDGGSELLIWYSDQLAQLLDVPELDNDCRSGDLYRCPKCGDQFQYSNCLRAHLRFRCRYRKQHPKTSDVITCRQPSPHATSGQLTASSNDADVRKTISRADTMRHSVKRKADDESDGEVVAVKRRSSADVPLQTGDVQGPRTVDVELNKFVGVVGAPRAPCRSAFQRVDKTSLGPTTPPSPSQAISSSSPSDVATIAPPPQLPLSVVTSASLTALDNTSTAQHVSTATSELLTFPATMHAQRLHTPMMLGAGFVTPNYPAPNVFYPKIGEEYARNFVTNNNSMTGNGNDVKFLSQSPLGIAVDPSRQSRLPQPPAALPMSVHSGYRTSNPMVERLLQLVSSPRPAQPSTKSTTVGGGGATLSATFPSLQLAQNWCAKCNTSFRMTSDLVYHMRTHHKRDLEPASQGRRKDDSKLRCDVCGETFKERHHLTRHMTSHT